MRVPVTETYDEPGEYLSRLPTSLWVTSCAWPSFLTCLYMLLAPAVPLKGGANAACAHCGNMGSRASEQRLFPPCITAAMQVLASCHADCCFSSVRDNTSRRSAFVMVEHDHPALLIDYVTPAPAVSYTAPALLIDLD